MEGWFYKALVLQSSNSKGLWFYRALVLQGSGSTGLWFYRVLVLQGSGSTGFWFYRALALQGSGSTGFHRVLPARIHTASEDTHGQQGYTQRAVASSSEQ